MSFFYNIVIAPIEWIIEFVFCVVLSRFEFLGAGGAILAVSLAVNFLALPLYNIADSIQLHERNLQLKMKKWVTHIKKTFNGDEQFMMLNAYYRENGYHPIYALRQSLSILIEIPFFIAAYHFLSHCSLLEGKTIFFLKDLSKPDSLFSFSIFSKSIVINFLPILMTSINIVSTAVYTKGAPLREKVQTYALSLIFLFILYNSPSGLVFYWILNNLFSLCKNIVQKIFSLKLSKKIKAFSFLDNISSKEAFYLLLFSVLCFWVLAGLLVPSNVIKTSPEEFSFMGNTDNPLEYIKFSALFFFGFFVLWPFIIFKMFKSKEKEISFFMFVFSVCSIASVFIFKYKIGNVSCFFELNNIETIKNYNFLYSVVPFIFLLLILFISFLVVKYKKISVLISIMLAIFLGESALTANNCIRINQGFKNYKELKERNSLNEEKLLALSPSENNILVLFFDKAISSFVPYIFDQFPEVKESFEGFVYYPNCISFGARTMLASPSMVAGYEYTPDKINERSNEFLREKHNEAMKVIPEILTKAGYDCVLGNPPYLNYSWGLDDTGFTDNPKLQIKNLRLDTITLRYKNEHSEDFKNLIPSDYIIPRTMVSFSVMMMVFPVFKKYIYGNSTYYRECMFNSEGFGNSFLDNYAFLYYLSDQFDYSSSNPTYNFLDIETTHEPALLYDFDLRPKVGFGRENIGSIGEYPASSSPEDTGFNDFLSYQINASSFIQISKFLRSLKDKGLYNNTRIIIVSDHGSNLEVPYFSGSDYSKEKAFFNPTFMVKDFNAKGPVITDNSFLTNAETINWVLKDLPIEKKNPFTGKTFASVSDFESFKVYEVRKRDHETRGNGKITQFDLSGGFGFSVKDSIFEPDNWKYFDGNEVE